jgi:hypothetical protein
MRRFLIAAAVLASLTLAAGAQAQQQAPVQRQRPTPEQRQERLAQRQQRNPDLQSGQQQAGKRRGQLRKMMMQRRLRKMDQDRNGSIARQEWRGRSEMFDRLDVNKDGSVTREEIRSLLQQRRKGSGSANIIK